MAEWSRVTDLFNAALERQAGERAGFLDRECGGDQALRAEVASLLAAHEDADAFLEAPAAVSEKLVEAEAVAPAFLRDARRRERLRLEARAAAALSHPGIATVYSLDEIEGFVCLVSEYLDGQTLRDELDGGPLPVPRLLETGIALARALAAAHAAGVVHRDLKPENVRRDEAGHPHIVDFGIARLHPSGARPRSRLTHAGAIVGTPGYVSPEQLEGAEADARSDIFSLGVVLYELAAGRHPFEAATAAAATARVLAAAPPRLSGIRPGLPAGFEAVVRGCLARGPGERYQSATEVAEELEAVQAGRWRLRLRLLGDRPLPTLEAPEPARRWWRWHQMATLAVAAAMIVPVARLHALDQSDWTLGALLAAVVTAVLNGSVRVHLLFTGAFNRSALPAQIERSRWILQASSLLFAGALLAAALIGARRHTVAAGILAAVAIGWAVTSLLAEPSTRRAAFDDPASPRATGRRPRA
ncbi:MAG: stkP 2 [Acidobacteria bacterium]|nr:stkP 2 [Acidobacteriota bacterium]